MKWQKKWRDQSHAIFGLKKGRARREQAAFAESVDQLTGASGIPHIKLDYEELLNHRDKSIRRILNFLDVDIHLPLDSPDLKKATPNRLIDAITNYDELVKAVQETDFSPLLEQADD